MNNRDPYDLRANLTHFRILVIGRGNAGKTTLLQRVCNTTEDPCIYDDNGKNLVSVSTRRWMLPLKFQTSLYLPQRYSTYYRYLLAYLTLPISAWDTRYQSGVRIQEQPQIYLPRFSWIWDRRQEAMAGSTLVYGEEIKVDWSRRSAACYLVSFATSAYILATDDQFCGERFCFVLNGARPLFPLESMFFETARAGKGFYHPIFQAFTLD